jgi:hypothetical protein
VVLAKSSTTGKRTTIKIKNLTNKRHYRWPKTWGRLLPRLPRHDSRIRYIRWITPCQTRSRLR